MTALTQDSFIVHHPRDCRMDSKAPWGRIGAFWAMHSCRRKLARKIRPLRDLSDHVLNDIGLSRSLAGGSDRSLYGSDQMIRMLTGR